MSFIFKLHVKMFCPKTLQISISISSLSFPIYLLISFLNFLSIHFLQNIYLYFIYPERTPSYECQLPTIFLLIFLIYKSMSFSCSAFNSVLDIFIYVCIWNFLILISFSHLKRKEQQQWKKWRDESCNINLFFC